MHVYFYVLSKILSKGLTRRIHIHTEHRENPQLPSVIKEVSDFLNRLKYAWPGHSLLAVKFYTYKNIT